MAFLLRHAQVQVKTAVLILFSILVSGCSGPEERTRVAAMKRFAEQGRVRRWPALAWSERYTHQSANYTVHTNTSAATAEYIAQLMELAAARFQNIFGNARAGTPRMRINAYARRAEYEKFAIAAGFARGATAGFYHLKGTGVIHLPYVMTGEFSPSLTLLHEGTHQFVHQTIDYRLPRELRSHFPPGTEALVSVPLWLNEGLATYMETAEYDGRTLVVGRVNQHRLRYLKKLLKAGKAPSIREVLKSGHGERLSREHYSVAWGLVYDLLHGRDGAQPVSPASRFVQYVEACRNGFFPSQGEGLRKRFFSGSDLPRTFGRDWRKYISEESLKAFRRTFVGPDSSIEEWQAGWRNRMSKLGFR